jgi:hypothetical protein
MSALVARENLLSQVDELKGVIAQTAASPVPSGIVEQLLKEFHAQLLRLRDDALQVPEATAPILQKYLYETPEVRDLTSVCSLVSGTKISFSNEPTFSSEQLRRNAVASANGLNVRQLFIVSDWLDIALDPNLILAIQGLLHSGGRVRVIESNSSEYSASETFTIFNLDRVAKAVFIQNFNRVTRETKLTLTVSKAQLAKWVEIAEALWLSDSAFNVGVI